MRLVLTPEANGESLRCVACDYLTIPEQHKPRLLMHLRWSFDDVGDPQAARATPELACQERRIQLSCAFTLEGRLCFPIGMDAVDRKHQLRAAGTHGLK